MADLREDDRAQVLLVAGFVLAASFVALTLVLNSVIYTENLATRGADAAGGEAITYRDDITEGVEPMVESVNRNASSQSEIQDQLSRAVVSTSRRAARFQVLGGISANATLASINWGTRIGQNRTTGNFTNSTAPSSADVASDWTVATGVDGTRSVQLNVTDSAELALQSNGPLELQVTDGTPWVFRLFKNNSAGTTTAVEVDPPSGPSRICSAGKNPTVGLTAGTFNGTDCPGLEYGEDVSTPYTIAVENGRQYQGTYSLVVDEEIDSGDIESDNYGTAPDVPFTLTGVYAATVHVEYRSTSLTYATDARIRPGESDD